MKHETGSSALKPYSLKGKNPYVFQTDMFGDLLRGYCFYCQAPAHETDEEREGASIVVLRCRHRSSCPWQAAQEEEE